MINKLKSNLAQLSLDGMYIINLTNVRYLTGFTGSAGSVLILNEEQHFFTDGRYIEQSKEQVKNCTIHIVGSAHFLEIERENLIPKKQKIALEADYVSVNYFDKLQKKCSPGN